MSEMAPETASQHGGGGGNNDATAQSHVDEPTDVKVMERRLVKLMHDFNSGNLRAFGGGVSVAQMERIREQQECLARLHFDLGSQQQQQQQQQQQGDGGGLSSRPGPLSGAGLERAAAGMQQLMQQLQQLSSAIEKLHSAPATSTASSHQDTTHG